MIQSIEDGRKEDGNRSIADKIIKRLHDLEKTVENNQGRWAWELLQNAKDSIADYEDKTVSVRIISDYDKVEFQHNGIHFTEQDIRGLINQISSKEIEEGAHSKKTGRFGTGFLTTHLLSKVIQVKGIVETVNKKFYSFEFPLDREGKITQHLVPKIENAWKQFHDSATELKNAFNETNFNTSFVYHLATEEQKHIAKIGIEEFIKLLPFVLAFIPKIGEVEIIDNDTLNTTIFKNTREIINDIIVPISKVENGEESKILILLASDEKVSIATEIESNQEGYSVKSIKHIPKLFCDFPLIGSETFHFPVILNSFYFNPQTERDGIWLKGTDDLEVEENQSLFKKALVLYENVLAKLVENNFSDLYNFADTRLPYTNDKYFDEKWYKNEIQKPIRKLVFESKIVELENSEDNARLAPKDLWFPPKSFSSSVQENIWQYTFDLFPSSVCKKNQLQYWCEISWDDWNKQTYNQLVDDLKGHQSIRVLSEALRKDESQALAWLNSLCDFLLKDDSNLALFENNAITPNQNGDFKKRKELSIDKIKDDDLIDILELLGEDWKNILLYHGVSFGAYSVKEKKDIAAKITEKLKNPSYKTDDSIKAISLLSEWFEYKSDIAKDLFSELYRKRAELFMNTISDKENLYKVMRSKTDLAQLSKIAQTLEENPHLLENIQKAEQLTSLLKEFNINDLAELKKALIAITNGTIVYTPTEITQDILISLGVTSKEELEEALKDKDIASLYTHSSTPNADMFFYVQKLIARAKKNIIEHLMELPNYDCSDIEELATTVIGGIKKEGLLIHVVIRPSDNGQVIVYYSSERDTLDFENAELWIDNGIEEPRHLTLGKILKTTGINKIPV